MSQHRSQLVTYSELDASRCKKHSNCPRSDTVTAVEADNRPPLLAQKKPPTDALLREVPLRQLNGGNPPRVPEVRGEGCVPKRAEQDTNTGVAADATPATQLEGFVALMKQPTNNLGTFFLKAIEKSLLPAMGSAAYDSTPQQVLRQLSFKLKGLEVRYDGLLVTQGEPVFPLASDTPLPMDEPPPIQACLLRVHPSEGEVVAIAVWCPQGAGTCTKLQQLCSYGDHWRLFSLPREVNEAAEFADRLLVVMRPLGIFSRIVERTKKMYGANVICSDVVASTIWKRERNEANANGMKIVTDDDVLGEMVAALRSPIGQAGQCVVVGGPSGSGKTVLALNLSEHLDEMFHLTFYGLFDKIRDYIKRKHEKSDPSMDAEEETKTMAGVIVEYFMTVFNDTQGGSLRSHKFLEVLEIPLSVLQTEIVVNGKTDIKTHKIWITVFLDEAGSVRPELLSTFTQMTDALFKEALREYFSQRDVTTLSPTAFDDRIEVRFVAAGTGINTLEIPPVSLNHSYLMVNVASDTKCKVFKALIGDGAEEIVNRASPLFKDAIENRRMATLVAMFLKRQARAMGYSLGDVTKPLPELVVRNALLTASAEFKSLNALGKLSQQLMINAFTMGLQMHEFPKDYTLVDWQVSYVTASCGLMEDRGCWIPRAELATIASDYEAVPIAPTRDDFVFIEPKAGRYRMPRSMIAILMLLVWKERPMFSKTSGNELEEATETALTMLTMACTGRPLQSLLKLIDPMWQGHGTAEEGRVIFPSRRGPGDDGQAVIPTVEIVTARYDDKFLQRSCLWDPDVVCIVRPPEKVGYADVVLLVNNTALLVRYEDVLDPLPTETMWLELYKMGNREPQSVQRGCVELERSLPDELKQNPDPEALLKYHMKWDEEVVVRAIKEVHWVMATRTAASLATIHQESLRPASSVLFFPYDVRTQGLLPALKRAEMHASAVSSGEFLDHLAKMDKTQE